MQFVPACETDSKFIVWEDERKQEGRLYHHFRVENKKRIGTGSNGPCFSPRRSIEEFIHEAMNSFVEVRSKTLLDFKEGKKNPKDYSFIHHGFLKPLTGWFSVFGVGGNLAMGRNIQEKIQSVFVPWFYQQLSDLSETTNLSGLSDFSDIEFLAKTSLKWNWRDECPICLQEPEKKWINYVAISRPCGHFMCVKPANLIGGPSRDRFHQYFQSQIDQGKTSLSCPTCKCKITKVIIPQRQNLGRFRFDLRPFIESLGVENFIKKQEEVLLEHEKELDERC